MKSVKEYVLANPLRAIKESYEMSQFQILDMIDYLHSKGVGIVVMSGIDDPVFRTRNIKKPNLIHNIDGFMTMKGGHGAIGEQIDHIVWVDKILTALKNKKDKKTKFYTPNLLEEFK